LQEGLKLNDLQNKAHRILGALILGGSADALGWRNESASTTTKRKPIFALQSWAKRIGRVGGYWDRIEPGEYSDDTQLTLAVARCISPDGTYDPDRFVRVELPYWLSYERGGGRTIRAAARNALGNPNVTWHTNIFDGYYESGANGAAMRVLPFALIRDQRAMIQAVWQNTLATHGHPRAVIGALVMAYSLHHFMYEEYSPESLIRAIQEFIAALEPPVQPDFVEWMKRADERNQFRTVFGSTKREMKKSMDIAFSKQHLPPSDVLGELGAFDKRTKGSGIGTVAAAHYFFFKYSKDPVRAVVEAANAFGADTDTIAKLCGDILGCLHGRAAYENDFAAQVLNRYYFLNIARYLVGKEDPHWLNLEPRDTDITEIKKEGDGFHSKIFGPGIITSVRKPAQVNMGAATLHQVRAEFLCGITCVFSKTKPVPNGTRHLWESETTRKETSVDE
jgi:ADP-ribosylglycohydrolase